MNCCRLYGVRLDSDHHFRIPLWPGQGAAELRLEVHRGDLPELTEDAVVYRSPLRTADDEAVSVLYRRAGREVLSFADGTLFELAEERIAYRAPGPPGVGLLELRFLGPVMAYWLERRGVLALHASVVEVDGLAVAFLAPRGGGKTSLAATFMAAGHRLLADDLLALAIDPSGADPSAATAHAGYPAMRFWPDQVERYLGERFLVGAEPLPRVHPDVDKRIVELGSRFGVFAPDSRPLAAVYLLRRTESAPRPLVGPVRGSTVVKELLQCSFTPYIVEAVGLQASRLDRLTRLAELVPVRRLELPADLDHLPAAHQAVLADLATSGSPVRSGGERGVR